MGLDLFSNDVWGVDADDLTDAEREIVIEAEQGGTDWQVKAFEIAKRYRVKYGIPEDEGLCGLFYTGDSEDRPGRSEIPSGCFLFGVGKYEIVQFVARHPSLSRTLFQEHGFQWSNWVTGG